MTRTTTPTTDTPQRDGTRRRSDSTTACGGGSSPEAEPTGVGGAGVTDGRAESRKTSRKYLAYGVVRRPRRPRGPWRSTPTLPPRLARSVPRPLKTLPRDLDLLPLTPGPPTPTPTPSSSPDGEISTEVPIPVGVLSPIHSSQPLLPLGPTERSPTSLPPRTLDLTCYGSRLVTPSFL